jgi:hypothetical protein
MVTELFIEDFDGNGPGFKGPPFSAWSIGGTPIDAGRWKLFYPEMGAPENLTGGSGRYASVQSDSSEFIDTLVWLISPLIDVEKYRNLTLNADIYLEATGSAGEDTLTISLLTIKNGHGKSPSIQEHTIDVVGEHLSFGDVAQGSKSWDLSACTRRRHLIQLSFGFYSSMGSGVGQAPVQLDNISITGDKKTRMRPPKDLKVKK